MGQPPPFTPDGVLPAGDWEMTLEQLRSSFLVEGPAEGYPELGCDLAGSTR